MNRGLPNITATDSLADRYLALLKKSLTGTLQAENYALIPPNKRTLMKRLRYAAYSALQAPLKRMNLALVQTNRPTGETMMGMGALDNLHDCLDRVQQDAVPGDLVETGVWRGGGTIFMRGFLLAKGDQTRRVWACDSFEGLPKPNAEKYEADLGDQLWASEYLAVSLDQVKANFAKYDLLDDQVKFLKGFFSDTMPTAPIEQISLLRLDGDMYESTIVVLEHLYPKLAKGGFVIFDDYGMIPACDKAVDDYRRAHGIEDPLEIIGYVNGKPLGSFWRKR